MTSPATYRCTACGVVLLREHSITGLVAFVHPGPCAGVVVDIARDDRAGVTLPTAVEPVGGDQFVPGGTGQGDQVVERRHGDSIATGSLGVDVNRTSAGGPAASLDFTERKHA